MTTIVTLVFNSDEQPWSALRALFESCGFAQQASKGPDSADAYIIKCHEGSPEHACLTQGLRALGVSWSENRLNVYSPEELREAPLLRLVVTRAPRGIGGPTHGTKYDLSAACPNCGAGARQVSPLVMAASEVPRSAPIFETMSGEQLVSGALKETIDAIAPTGLKLRQAVEASTRSSLPYYQLRAAEELPPEADDGVNPFLRTCPFRTGCLVGRLLCDSDRAPRQHQCPGSVATPRLSDFERNGPG
jgi:hypothetical protein